MDRNPTASQIMGLVALAAVSCGDGDSAPLSLGDDTTGGSGATVTTGGAGGAAGTAAGSGGNGGSESCADHCQDDALNCGETWIDCGGECASCTPVEIAPSSMRGLYPTVAAASASRVMLLWQVSSGRVRYACFDGSTWTDPAPLSDGSGQENNPWVVEDSTGAFHAVYSHGFGGNRQIHYASWAAPDCADTWSEPEVASALDTPGHSSAFASVGVDENDVPYAMWSQAGVPHTSAECDGNGVCSQPGYTCPGNVPHGDCKPWAYTQHFSRRLGSSWEPPMEVSSPHLSHIAHHGALFVHSSSDVHAAWAHAEQGSGQRLIYYAHFDGSHWTAPQYTGMNARMADVQADPTNVFLFSCKAGFVSRAKSSNDWGTVTNLPGGGAPLAFISLRVDTSGRLHAVWSREARIVYSVKDPGDGWQPPKLVSPDVDQYAEPSADVDPAGYVHITWTECSEAGCPSTGEHGAIWYLRTRYEEL